MTPTPTFSLLFALFLSSCTTSSPLTLTCRCSLTTSSLEVSGLWYETCTTDTTREVVTSECSSVMSEELGRPIECECGCVYGDGC